MRSALYPLLPSLLFPLFVGACTSSARKPATAERTAGGPSEPTQQAVADEVPQAPNDAPKDKAGARESASKTEGTATAAASAAPPPARRPEPAASTALSGHGGGTGAAAKDVPAPPSAPALSRAVGDDRDREEDNRWVAQGGSIKAGEWDDNANYREFQHYLANEETLPIHRVDVSDRNFLVVRDSEGKAVPRCSVLVTDDADHTARLTTTTSGRAILFPHAERLTGRRLTAFARCGDATASARFPMVDQDGVVDLHLQSARQLPESPTIDVAFVLDTTGSMSEEIASVKSTIGKVAEALRQQNVGVRIGLVEYKDRGDPFVTKVHAMSPRVDRFLSDVAGIQASGGGDTPESVNAGVHVALTQLAWSPDSVGRFAFLIGDAPPHLDYPNDADYAVDMQGAAHRGIEMFTIAASGMDDLGQAVFRQIAQYTGATNMFVLRGGAGPQSTGAGDPKSSCGGTQTQYASGNLDGLIVSKIQHELHGLDRDPMRIAGLHVDENAKPCNERVALE